MPTLYRLNPAAPAIAAHFSARAGKDPWAGGTIAPHTFAPVITSGREEVAGPRPDIEPPRRLIPRLWGVPPPPSAGDPSRLVLTVRNSGSPFWMGNLKNSEFRCLVPASAFMAWGRNDPATGRRRQHWFAPADQAMGDQPLFAMAGVWKDSEIASFALLTCEPNALLREAGIERMPVILPADPRAWTTWLRGEWKRAEPLIAPYSSGMMRDLAAS
ncbi:SOS response-associated peptidase family protein [Novosphingobium aquae]|uniref:SOS response-associated peptidase family protein n=1 Tax=Novosphingobium aquae TaxID=3133435 RepID=A0ABU8SBE8_9SPHN